MGKAVGPGASNLVNLTLSSLSPVVSQQYFQLSTVGPASTSIIQVAHKVRPRQGNRLAQAHTAAREQSPAGNPGSCPSPGPALEGRAVLATFPSLGATAPTPSSFPCAIIDH